MQTKVNETYDEFEEDISANLLNPELIIDEDIQTKFNAIKFQLENLNKIYPSTARNNLSEFIENLSVISNAMEEKKESEKANILRTYMNDSLKFILQEMKEYMGIDPNSNAFNLIEDLMTTEGRDFVQALYEFLVVYRYENIVNLVFNIIESRIEDLAETYKPQVDRKDISSKTEKKKFKNTNISIIVNKLETIIDDILNGSFEISDPITTITKGLEDNWHNSVVLEEMDYISVPKLTTVYFGDLYKQENKSEAYSMLVLSVRSKIYDKYASQPKE